MIVETWKKHRSRGQRSEKVIGLIRSAAGIVEAQDRVEFTFNLPDGRETMLAFTRDETRRFAEELLKASARLQR